MTVTASATGDYVVHVGTGGAAASLKVTWGTSVSEVWRWSSDGSVTFYGEIEGAGPFVFDQRDTATSITVFVDSSSTTVATVDKDGRWICNSSQGAALRVETADPTDAPASGTTRFVRHSGPVQYFVAGYVGGAWRKVLLPN